MIKKVISQIIFSVGTSCIWWALTGWTFSNWQTWAFWLPINTTLLMLLMDNLFKYTSLEKRAYDFAEQRHKGQKDDHGKDYFQAHPVVVGEILKTLGADEHLVAAGYLHDTIEDTSTIYEELKMKFGGEVADLVNEVTQEGKKDSGGYYFPRLKTQKGIMLKFADRLSNLSRMEVWSPKRREHYLKKSKFWKSSL